MTGIKRVCVLMGGESDERNISLRSGRAVVQALRRQGLNVTPVDARNGFKRRLERSRPDVVFIALHGKGGEDGVVQRELDRLGFSYVGSSATGSLNAFDKWKAKKLFLRNRIPTPEARFLTKRNWKKMQLHVLLPAVIKPTMNGSSIGVIMAETRAELRKAIEKSVQCYGEVLAERRIEGREFTVGILDGKALPVVELRPKRCFYDYKAKYTKGLTDYLVPAPIGEDLSLRLQKLAERVHQVLGLKHFCRVDVMVDCDEKPYVLEANTIPGFTNTSLLPKAAFAAGINFEELCFRLIELAREVKPNRA